MRKDQIFLFACIGYIGGVFVGSFFLVPEWIWLLFLSLWFICLVSFPSRNVFVSLLFLLLFFFGVTSVERSLGVLEISRLEVGKVSGTARVVSDPEIKNFFREIVFEMENCRTTFCPSQRILWQASVEKEIARGSRMDFVCDLMLPENFDTTFDYRMFLAKTNIVYVCKKAETVSLLPSDALSQFFHFLFVPKRFFERALEKSIPAPESELALGLLIGGNDRLPHTLSQAFTTAGLTHIVAISGYNIALIAQGFIFLGLFIGLFRRQALWFALIGIILFVVLVGAPASAVRAGIMGVSVFLGLFFGRMALGMNMLFFAGATMLFFQPLLLRYDIGFQLSFLATFALILTVPIVQFFLKKEFLGKNVAELILLTFSVELFVVPIIAYQFHIFSPFSLLMNILILPLIPYAMMTSFVTAIAFLILPGLHILPAFIAYSILRGITLSVETLSLSPFASQTVSLSLSWLFLWYSLLLLLFVGIYQYMHHTYVEKTTL